MEKNYLVWSLEHNKWWKPNGFGYTSDIDQAGSYDYESAKEICISANIGSEINECFVDKYDLKEIKRVQNLTEPLTKKDIGGIISPFNTGYTETNPLGRMVEALEKHHHYPEEVNIPHVNYETTERLTLKIKNSQHKVEVSLYRMPSGRYECTAYTGTKQENKITDKVNKLKL